MFAQEFCFNNFKRYSIKTNTFHYNSLLPLQRTVATWMSVKVPYVPANKTQLTTPYINVYPRLVPELGRGFLIGLISCCLFLTIIKLVTLRLLLFVVLFHTLLKLPLFCGDSVFGLCFVIQCLMSLIVLQ